ncbi:hypothetical protein PL321_16945 [Caloramator sp. mosi_1]|nr:hypothetical protein [Caloramator sp. mosi_1]WDC85867.1 hypothetical protein PL321_16945 [Caloramator sp. mosi_1]
MLDRIDIHIELSPVKFEELQNNKDEIASIEILKKLLRQEKFRQNDLKMKVFCIIQV